MIIAVTMMLSLLAKFIELRLDKSIEGDENVTNERAVEADSYPI